MIETIVVAIFIAIVVGALLVFLLGPIINTIPAPVAQIAGSFFVQWGWAIGIAIAVFWAFVGPPIFGLGHRK